MRKLKKPSSSAPRFELVRENTWLVVSPVTERYFLFYVDSFGASHQVTYAELEFGSKYSSPQFKAEIYQTRIWATAEHLMPLIEAIQASVLLNSIESPSHLVYEFGGTYTPTDQRTGVTK